MTRENHMEPDEYQQAWQAQSAQTRITIDKDALLKEVQRQQHNFGATIYWRDFREIVIGLLMIPMWFYLGFTYSLPWTWYLTVLALVWIIGFLIVDRRRHPPTPNDPAEPLIMCVKNSLAQAEHQIWLLRNVFWWYLLPFTISIMAFFAQFSWQTSDVWLIGLGLMIALSVFLLVLYGFVYYLNQYAVRKHLEPQRQELLTLLTSLEDETASSVSGEYPILMNARNVECSPRRMFIANMCTIAILILGVPAIVYLAYHIDRSISVSPDRDSLKRSPFSAVRWREFQPEVKVDADWYELVSLDGIPVEEIVAFSQRTYDDQWQKRFEEDLVELLTRMDHPPKDTVKLVVQSLNSSETQVLEDVPLTEANREAVKEAARAREHKQP